MFDAMDTPSMPQPGMDNWSHERQLAEVLLKTMSLQEAIQWCCEHGWEGTLQTLQRYLRLQGE
jgi:hypothetical protein